VYGSMEEYLAILEYNRQRAISFLSPIIAAESPDKREQIVRKFRGIIYPEDAYDDADYVKKAHELFDKIKDMSFFVKTGE